jgi:hypothetical protein
LIFNNFIRGVSVAKARKITTKHNEARLIHAKVPRLPGHSDDEVELGVRLPAREDPGSGALYRLP